MNENLPNGDSNYVLSGTTGHVDQCAMTDLPAGSEPVLSVTVTALARLPIAPNFDCYAELGGPCYANLRLRVNGIDHATVEWVEGSPYPAYYSFSRTWDKNPETNQPWTRSEVNALQAGVKREDGNFVSRVTQLCVTVDLADSVTSTTYTHNDGPTGMNELLSINRDETRFTYTANGDLWTKAQGGVTWTYAYNEAGLLKEAKEGSNVWATYFYDGLGRRVKAVEESTTTFFVYGLGFDPLWEKNGTSGTETRHLYANGLRIARMTVSGSTYLCHTDALGSTWRMTDAAKGTIFSTSYGPFGRPWGTTGSLAGSERYTFLGERNDTESGWTYLRARQYDPATGRFTSMDPGRAHSPSVSIDASGNATDRRPSR